jgi:hypothetical protein
VAEHKATEKGETAQGGGRREGDDADRRQKLAKDARPAESDAMEGCHARDGRDSAGAADKAQRGRDAERVAIERGLRAEIADRRRRCIKVRAGYVSAIETRSNH